MFVEDLKNKTVGIIGFGLEGQAVAAFLKKNHINFLVFDKNPNLSNSAEVFFGGDNYLNSIQQCDVLFRSPGVPINSPELQQFLKSGKKITSQIKFFFEHSRAKIIGVTGTKGKGTTSKLIYEIIRDSGLKCHLAGNIGSEALSLLEDLTPDDWVVLELSSFQLQDLEQSPNLAVVLMVTEDHLNYHKDLAEYIFAKGSITRYQTPNNFAVINGDYENSRVIGNLGRGRKYFVHTFAKEAQENLNFVGIYASQKDGLIYLNDFGVKKVIGEISDLSLRGFHNTQNVCASLQTANLLNLDMVRAWKVCLNYHGLEHRLEFVTEKAGIKFYNDSAGTNPVSVVTAARSFREPLIIICGGSNKGFSFEEMALALNGQKNIKAMILIGEVAPKIVLALAKIKFPGKIILGAENMLAIFTSVEKVARQGDVVILAPGTASFGMFRDYKDRGNQFKKAALNYAN